MAMQILSFCEGGYQRGFEDELRRGNYFEGSGRQSITTCFVEKRREALRCLVAQS